MIDTTDFLFFVLFCFWVYNVVFPPLLSGRHGMFGLFSSLFIYERVALLDRRSAVLFYGLRFFFIFFWQDGWVGLMGRGRGPRGDYGVFNVLWYGYVAHTN